jgi:hypothetical protein
VGAEPHKAQSGAVGFLVNKYQVRPYLAVAVILPVAGQRVIAATHFKWQIVRQQIDNAKKLPIERDPMLTFAFAPVIAFELLRSIQSSALSAFFNSSMLLARGKFPARDSLMAATVAAFGINGSNGKACSRATRVSIRRTASDTVSPIAASTAAASALMVASMRVCTS